MDTALYVLLLLAAGALVISLIILVKAIRLGRTVSQGRRSLLLHHRQQIDRFLYSLLPPVAFIEIMVRLQGGRLVDNSLFQIHFVFVLGFLVTAFLSRFVWTGVKSPARHRGIVYLFLFFFVGVAITGGVLVARLITQ
jgi:hypothetical protein